MIIIPFFITLIFFFTLVSKRIEKTIVGAVAATVLLSIFAHGVSALPGIKWYAQQIENLDESAPELQETDSVIQGREI